MKKYLVLLALLFPAISAYSDDSDVPTSDDVRFWVRWSAPLEEWEAFDPDTYSAQVFLYDPSSFVVDSSSVMGSSAPPYLWNESPPGALYVGDLNTYTYDSQDRLRLDGYLPLPSSWSTNYTRAFVRIASSLGDATYWGYSAQASTNDVSPLITQIMFQNSPVMTNGPSFIVGGSPSLGNFLGSSTVQFRGFASDVVGSSAPVLLAFLGLVGVLLASAWFFRSARRVK